MSAWRPSASNMRSGFPPTASCKSGLATCSRAWSGVRRTKCAASTRTSPIRPEAGQNRRQGRMASGRTLPARRLYRHQHGEAGRQCRRLLQQARDVRAMDQGRQGRDPMDAALSPLVRRQTTGDLRLDDRRLGIPWRATARRSAPERIYKPRLGHNYILVLPKSCYRHSQL